MAITKIEVNTNTLKGDVDKFIVELQHLKEDVNKLRETSSQLSSMWDGIAKQATVAAVSDDIGKLELLIKAMEDFTRATDTVRGNYDRCEQNVGSIVSSLKV
ncbi:MAG: hypothetical protein IKI35_01750 [Stomatobaculum sp.]|jgi:uncharacterized protein YukE|nr:hypothetical protein [Stomatobaculum sp.]MBR7057432.1 hypothetical protein [Stomatobaculum sp.]